MSEHTAPAAVALPPASSALREGLRQITGYWWVGVVAGVAWLAASVVILQFASASVTTVGILVGLLFLLAALENVVVASVPGSVRWPSIFFAGLFTVSAVLAFIEPQQTFAGFADMLGFLFSIVGIWWMVRSFLERPLNPVWWLGLISGILMTVVAFWTAGQFFIERAYTLLVLAGIWALMQGINAIVRAFAVRQLHELF
jgi:uncharacterized membrane protein HdeD (DUF308 family)